MVCSPELLDAVQKDIEHSYPIRQPDEVVNLRLIQAFSRLGIYALESRQTHPVLELVQFILSRVWSDLDYFRLKHAAIACLQTFKDSPDTTARLTIDYFTKPHPNQFAKEVDQPTLQAALVLLGIIPQNHQTGFLQGELDWTHLIAPGHDARKICPTDPSRKQIHRVEEVGQFLVEDLVCTNGALDILTAGHISHISQMLQIAGLQATIMATLDPDSFINMLKGSDRPRQTGFDRQAVLAAQIVIDIVFLPQDPFAGFGSVVFPPELMPKYEALASRFYLGLYSRLAPTAVIYGPDKSDHFLSQKLRQYSPYLTMLITTGLDYGRHTTDILNTKP